MLSRLLSLSSAAGPLYSDDVFSSYNFTFNGLGQSVVNGIDLAGKGGLVWLKHRVASRDHALYDTSRGVNYSLKTNSANAQITYATDTLTNFNSNGFTLGVDSSIQFSQGVDDSMASWTFRKAPKFFDVVTWTGTGGARDIPHNLGVTPGLVIVKRLELASDWRVWHKDISINDALRLNNGDPVSVYAGWNLFNTSTATVLGTRDLNNPGGLYIAYLFAHDTDTVNGIIQCGSFTTDGINSAAVTLGWEPQYLMVKATSAAEDWKIWDTARGFSNGSNDAVLYPNSHVIESSSGNLGYPAPTGFNVTTGLAANTTYIYMAIRRPNKPPTVGTQVYNAIARTGTGATATVTGVGFAPDLVVAAGRPGGLASTFYDRLRGSDKWLRASTAEAEYTTTDEITAFNADGISVGASASYNINSSAVAYINHFFKRAPGVFDVICYTGTGANKTEAHGLGVVPELVIYKMRESFNVYDWAVYHAALTTNNTLRLNATNAQSTFLGTIHTATPTASLLNISSPNTTVNGSGHTYVAYLFATKAGISKVGNYTGNGSSLTVNCGFTTGARFILIKRTDVAGDWYVWDTVRGVIAGTDPHLSLNTSAAEVTTDDSIDPDTSGFIVNQLVATNINVTAATYIYLAFA